MKKNCKKREKLISILKEEGGAVYFFEASYILPITILLIFFLLVLSLLFAQAAVEFANHRTELMSEERNLEPASQRQFQVQESGREGQIFQKNGRVFSKNFQLPSVLSFIGMDQKVFHRGSISYFINDMDRDLWHLLTIQSWIEKKTAPD